MRSLFATCLLAAACLSACSDDSLSGTGAGTTTETTTGAGGTTTTAGTGGASSGGTAGSGGSGAGPTGGAGGSTTTAGSGGTGTGGTGGAETGTLLVAASGIPDVSPTLLSWTAAAGWVTEGSLLPWDDGSLAAASGGAVGVFRFLDSTFPITDDHRLFYTSWTPGGGLLPVTQTDIFAADRPSVAPHGGATMITALDLQYKHGYTQLEAGMLSPFGAIPGGMPGTQAFGPSGTRLAPYGIAGVYASYSGDDEHLYLTLKPGPGSIWTPSQQAPTSPVVNVRPPALVVDADDDLHLFYIRKSDGRLCTVELVTPQNTWSAEEVVHMDAIPGRSPSAVRLSGDDMLVAWLGFDGTGIYLSRRTAGAWSAPVTVEDAATPSWSEPVVVTGMGGADAEILYAAGAKLRWARVTGATVTFGDDPMVSTVDSVVAVALP